MKNNVPWQSIEQALIMRKIPLMLEIIAVVKSGVWALKRKQEETVLKIGAPLS